MSIPEWKTDPVQFERGLKQEPFFLAKRVFSKQLCSSQA